MQNRKVVNWRRCDGGQYWCSFDSVPLFGLEQYGVYIIGVEQGPFIQTLYVGQGVIRHKLLQHRRETYITAYKEFGVLRITWTIPYIQDNDAIERYVTDSLKPKEYSAHPDVQGITVNLPPNWIVGCR